MAPASPDALPAAPLDAARLRAALRAARPTLPGDATAAGGPATPVTIWTDIRVVAETGSTNEDVLKLAAGGAPEGLVIAAEAQTAGKGRLGRSWRARPGSALTFSVLLRPDRVPPPARGWAPLLAGVATVRALRRGARGGPGPAVAPDVAVCGRQLGAHFT